MERCDMSAKCVCGVDTLASSVAHPNAPFLTWMRVTSMKWECVHCGPIYRMIISPLVRWFCNKTNANLWVIQRSHVTAIVCWALCHKCSSSNAVDSCRPSRSFISWHNAFVCPYSSIHLLILGSGPGTTKTILSNNAILLMHWRCIDSSGSVIHLHGKCFVQNAA